MADWLKIAFSAPVEMIDALQNFVTEIGAEGVFQETREPLSPSPTPSPAPPSGEVLQAFFPFDARTEERVRALERYIDSLGELFPEMARPRFKTEIIRDPGWGEAWKKYFKPLRASCRIVIKPTWEPFIPAAGDIVIEIDPGMAFGTGQHASTEMCLKTIDEIFRNEGPNRPRRVFDVGTGTGILGIACAKLGAEKVFCIDNDRQATEIARENVRVNRVEERVNVSDRHIADVAGPFDLVLANLTAKVLVDLYSHLDRLVRPGGSLVISGILDLDRTEIQTRFLNDSFPAHSLMTEKEWVCYLLKKADTPR